MSETDLFHDFLEPQIEEDIRVQLQLRLPRQLDIQRYEGWARVLLQQQSWLDGEPTTESAENNPAFSILIASHLQIIRLLFQLIRLPIFDLPKIYNLLPRLGSDKSMQGFDLELKLPLIHGVTHAIYQSIGQSTVHLCQWLSQHDASADNCERIYAAIEQKIIAPIAPAIRAGKSTIPVLRVAHQRGIPIKHLGLGIYQLGWGSHSRRLDRSSCELDSAMGSKLAQNKLHSAQLLRAAGLPAPTHLVVTHIDGAIQAAHQIGLPVVVKPNDRDRGEGVTVDIDNEELLKKAFDHAHHHSRSKQVIIERQVEGVCHRVFIAHGELLYCVKRHPMSIIGDGISSVQELVTMEINNQSQHPPWLRSEIRDIDELAIQALKRLSQMTPSCIPAQGQIVPLRRIESTEWGGTDENVTHSIHPDNIQLAIDAARLFGLSIAGVDIISPDLARPWYENKAIINEVNYAPLLGGAQISRSYIPKFMDGFIQGNGKIPINYFETIKGAVQGWHKHLQDGRKAFLITKNKTLDPAGHELRLASPDWLSRLRCLLLKRDVDAIVICNLDINDSLT